MTHRPRHEKMAHEAVVPHLSAIQREMCRLCAEITRLRRIIFDSAECATGGDKEGGEEGRCFMCDHRDGDRCHVDGELIPEPEDCDE
jgi:hypothetical protein